MSRSKAEPQTIRSVRWEALIFGILEQACEDLRDIRTHKSEIYRKDCNESELYEFFHSQWCEELTETVIPNMSGAEMYDKILRLTEDE